MRYRPVRRLVALGAAIAVAVLAGMSIPTGHVAPAAAADATTLTIALTQDVDTLNPFQAYYASSTQIGRLMYDFLTAYSPKDQRPVPGLADKWSYSADKLTWTYHIRTGERWSDGKPVTAHDVAFTYNRIMDHPATWGKANGNFVSNFASVTATNDHTLVIRTKTPQATMLALDIPVVPEHIWKNVKDVTKYTNDQGPIVGDGPFILAEHSPGQYITLRANKDYWRGAPKVDQLVLAIYKTSDAAVQALRKGEVDLISGLTSVQANALKKDKDVTVNQARGDRFTELSFNSGASTTKGVPVGDGNPALRNPAVRRALTYAIDKQTIVSRVEGGYAEAGSGYLPASDVTYHWQPPAEEKRSFDLREAGRLLNAAGYRKHSDGKRYGSNGTPLAFRYIGHSGSVDEKAIGSYIAGWFGQLGIGLTIKMESDSQLNTDLADGRFDLIMGGWKVDPDPDYVLAIQRCDARPGAPPDGSVNTDQYYCDKKYDQLYAREVSDFDPTTRAGLIKQMQALMYADAPSDILFYPDTIEAYRNDKFGGFQVQPEPGGRILDQNGFWGIYSATPVKHASRTRHVLSTEAGGDGHNILIGVLVGLAVVLAATGAIVTIRRRRATAGDRE